MGLPTVWLNRKSNGPDLNCLLFDETAGAIELAEHFLKQGIRDIVWFGPEYAKDLVIHYSSQVRYEAVKATMEKHGGRCEALFCRTGETLNANARKVCEMLPEFNGAICYNYTYRHTLLLETLAAGRNLNGKRIGHFASMWEFHPCEYDFLDYVVMPEVEMGRCGAKYILKTLRGKNADDLLVQLKGKLHKR
ncbi:hypothetical protein SDC9_130110 [bioreactor metagenome]|uniref:Periplasmic binding protein domain-containing protein n=1 Tax=bioreactor metagenome TaxID=1076179 RepID=A0A645D1H5_9ZZZZ